MSDNQQLVNLKNASEEILGMDRNEVLKTSYGQESFDSDIERTYDRCVELVKKINERDLESIPPQVLQQVQAPLNSVKSAMHNMLSASLDKLPNNQNWHQHRTNLGSKLAQAEIQLFEHVGNLFNMLELISPESYRNKTQHLVEYINKVEEQTREKAKEIDSLRDSVARAAGQAGVTKYSEIFQTQASEYKKVADKWLLAMIGFFVVIVGYGLYLLFCSKGDLKGAEIAARIILFSAFSYGLVVSSKNHKAYMHNFVVNTHRANSLNTFEAFSSAAVNPETRDIVLTQASNSIFTAQASGYNDGGTGDSKLTANIIDSVPKIMSKKS